MNNRTVLLIKTNNEGVLKLEIFSKLEGVLKLEIFYIILMII
jgi:hypothetical protein